MKNEMLKTETAELNRLETIIAKGQQTFLEVGDALAAIRDGRLYRADFETFEDYCQTKWGWTRQRSNQMITSAEVVKSLPSKMTTIVVNEGQARELAKVEPEKRAKVLRETAAAGPVTASSIRDHSSAYTSAPVSKPAPVVEKPVIELDKEGFPIPLTILPLWKRAEEEGRELIGMLRKVRNIIRHAQTEDDVVYSEINFSSSISHLSNVDADLKRILPNAVCTQCQGAKPKGCKFCGGRGFLSEFKWNLVPVEIKTIRAKAAKKL